MYACAYPHATVMISESSCALIDGIVVQLMPTDCWFCKCIFWTSFKGACCMPQLWNAMIYDSKSKLSFKARAMHVVKVTTPHQQCLWLQILAGCHILCSLRPQWRVHWEPRAGSAECAASTWASTQCSFVQRPCGSRQVVERDCEMYRCCIRRALG